ncbi:MAG: hypothetical protein P1U47_00200 [Zhongshania sp.]|uniref:hypothetical protein n=1 Tax=Zhongshania sp. TaxID=1971902 RepID=UPI00261C5A6A|nr:hypothetical protein [Zhongshania sp.]MDF1690762.1 hypothetical protein [Zhongshania sp.]
MNIHIKHLSLAAGLVVGSALASAQVPLGSLLGNDGILGNQVLALGDVLGDGTLDGLLNVTGLTLSIAQGQVLSDPLALVPTGIEIGLVYAFVPVLDVLYRDPLGIVDFLLTGNSILSESLFVVPAIPLVSSDLDLGILNAVDILGVGDLSVVGLAGLNGIGVLSPAELLPQVLIPVTSLGI